MSDSREKGVVEHENPRNSVPPENTENFTFSDLIEEVGGFGVWNIRLLSLSFYSCLLAACSHLSIIYLAFPPAFQCGTNIAPQNGTSSQVHCSSNCEEYTFDETVFTSTVVTEWNLICENANLLPTLTFTYMLGIVASILSSGILSDTLGRRRLVLGAALLHLLAQWTAWASPHFWLFLVARMFVGGSIHSVWAGLFILVQETTPRRLRSLTGGVMNFGWNIGALVICSVAFFQRDWRNIQLAMALSTIPLTLYFFILSESPRWLLDRGRLLESKQCLEKIAKTNGVSLDEKTMETKLNYVMDSSATYDQNKSWRVELSSSLLVLFSSRQMVKRIALLIPVFFSIGMASYGIHFAARFATLDLFTVSSIKEVANFCTTLILMACYQKMKRIPCLLTGFIVSGIVALSFGVVPEQGRPVVMVLAQALFVGNFYMADTYSPELMPTPARNLGFNLMDAISKVGSAVAPFIVELGGEYSSTLPVTVFGAVILASSGCFLFLPETKGLPLPKNTDAVEQCPGKSILSLPL